MAGTELQSTRGDVAAEVPSAEWGWSGEAPKFFRVMALIVAVFLLLMLIGNHEGHVESLYLIGSSALLIFIVVRDVVRRRRLR
ncbi:membrane protein [Rhodococcus pyridinivorans KG-16]|uniref:Membrane protein n=1 Tax=Rhodococcus pyridinivorans KG-16 TaxID=1441730 RepID=A0A0V9UNR1_9NOCA|nr:DUF2631 domain-containing protein [Rhodococcus pyridinivorans]KSZ59631.1 membrane protein [Rhodococcus pyridinivorans KG-16]